MLETVLMYLNNWFVVGRYDDTYTIEDGGITLPFLVNGQYFRIVGSLFNDGVYKYADGSALDETGTKTTMTDETFDGSVWALAIPRAVQDLSDEIKAWAEKNQPSAYTSESFGGYSYSKATGSNGAPMGWQEVFRAQLNPYRKIRETAYVQGRRPIRVYDKPFNPDYPWRW